MKAHDLGVYEDGWTKTLYCKICSAEGFKLQEDCPGSYKSGLAFFKYMTLEEFEKEFGPVDQNKLDGLYTEIYIKRID